MLGCCYYSLRLLQYPPTYIHLHELIKAANALYKAWADRAQSFSMTSRQRCTHAFMSTAVSYLCSPPHPPQLTQLTCCRRTSHRDLVDILKIGGPYKLERCMETVRILQGYSHLITSAIDVHGAMAAVVARPSSRQRPSRGAILLCSIWL